MTTNINGHLMPDTPTDVETVYVSRRDRMSHPDGKFDNGGRWEPSAAEYCDCCAGIRSPSRAHPYNVLVHCRTRLHVRNLQRKRAAEADAKAPANALRCSACYKLLELCECPPSSPWDMALYCDECNKRHDECRCNGELDPIVAGLDEAIHGVHHAIDMAVEAYRSVYAYTPAQFAQVYPHDACDGQGCEECGHTGYK